MSPITTHVLDQTRGLPARGVAVVLAFREGDGTWTELARGATDDDGRCRGLLPDGHALRPGVYRLGFATGDYFAARGVACFYPEVSVTFAATRPDEPHHVPLLLGPFGYTTYRGS